MERVREGGEKSVKEGDLTKRGEKQLGGSYPRMRRSAGPSHSTRFEVLVKRYSRPFGFKNQNMSEMVFKQSSRKNLQQVARKKGTQ